jgi:hypothetical protein
MDSSPRVNRMSQERADQRALIVELFGEDSFAEMVELVSEGKFREREFDRRVSELDPEAIRRIPELWALLASRGHRRGFAALESLLEWEALKRDLLQGIEGLPFEDQLKRRKAWAILEGLDEG